MRDPLLTVAMPLRDAGSIAWLALEALVRQVDAPPWELLVAEDDTRAKVRPGTWRHYGPRLAAAGCVGFDLLSCRGWPPLAAKWRQIAFHAARTSTGFLLCAGDDYSPPTRLEATYDALRRSGAHWMHWPRGYFWARGNSTLSQFNLHAPDYPGQTGCWMAASTAVVRELPEADVRKGVDGWMRGEIARVVGGEILEAEIIGDEWQEGLHTDGWNLISRQRADMCHDEAGPFSATDKTLQDILPEEIAHRLFYQGVT